MKSSTGRTTALDRAARARPDAQRDADDHQRDDAGDEDQRERLHRVVPLVEGVDEREPGEGQDAGEQRRAATRRASRPGRPAPGAAARCSTVAQTVVQAADDVADRVEDRLAVLGEQVDARRSTQSPSGILGIGGRAFTRRWPFAVARRSRWAAPSAASSVTRGITPSSRRRPRRRPAPGTGSPAPG